MPKVRCPGCSRTLNLSDELGTNRVKCRHCGQVFIVGTPAAPAGAARARAPRMKLRTKRPIALSMAVLGACLAGILAVVVLMSHFKDTVAMKYVDKNGNVVERRMSRREAEALRAEAERNKKAARAADRSDPAAEKRALQAAGEPTGQAAPGSRDQSGAQVRRLGPGDAKIADMGMDIAKGDVLGGGFVTGRVCNRHDEPVKSMTIGVELLDKDGNILFQGSTRCRYVPAQASVPYSLKTSGVSREQIGDQRVIASDVVMERALVCYVIDPSACEVKEGGGRVVVVGQVGNRTRSALKDVRIFCDFFSSRGVHHGSAVGCLDDGRTRMPAQPGRKYYFEVKFTPEMPGMTHRLFLRLVAGKADS